MDSKREESSPSFLRGPDNTNVASCRESRRRRAFMLEAG